MAKHDRTLRAIFTLPTLGTIRWASIEALMLSFGATIEAGRGSRIRVVLNEEEATFHRPHPRKEASKGAVESARRFLDDAGFRPE